MVDILDQSMQYLKVFQELFLWIDWPLVKGYSNTEAYVPHRPKNPRVFYNFKKDGHFNSVCPRHQLVS